jgi:hypothetical protein
MITETGGPVQYEECIEWLAGQGPSRIEPGPGRTVTAVQFAVDDLATIGCCQATTDLLQPEQIVGGGKPARADYPISAVSRSVS